MITFVSEFFKAVAQCETVSRHSLGKVHTSLLHAKLSKGINTENVNDAEQLVPRQAPWMEM